MKRLQCATLEGIEAIAVSVESTLTKGLPSFTIVGMASTAINEARERVKSALLANGFVFPPKRITINLSPSDVNKNGSHFDLGIALLIALDATETDLSSWYVFGELGLDGSVKENALLYPLVLSLANRGKMKKVLVPKESLPKVRNIPNIEFIGVEHLSSAIAFFKGEDEGVLRQDSAQIDYPNYRVNEQSYYFQKHYPIDFIDIKGQENAKRAALISASGFHNLLLEGSPGCGKSMIAKRLRYILPPVTGGELLDIAKLDSLAFAPPYLDPGVRLRRRQPQGADRRGRARPQRPALLRRAAPLPEERTRGAARAARRQEDTDLAGQHQGRLPHRLPLCRRHESLPLRQPAEHHTELPLHGTGDPALQKPPLRPLSRPPGPLRADGEHPPR